MADLILKRILKVPRALVWDCWTMPEHMKHWFMPKPHQLLDAEIELIPGGRFYTCMKVEDSEMKGEGCVLQVIDQEKLVFTDTMSAGFVPNARPFFTAVLTFADHPDGTEYTAVARHKDEETAQSHADMGFLVGWDTVATQLESYAQSLMAGH